MGKNKVPMFAIITGVFCHAISSYYFVIYLGLGIHGTGIAMTMTQLVIMAV